MENLEDLIPEPIRDTADDVFEYASSISTLFELRIHVMRYLQNEECREFSKRDLKTLFYYPNKMEFALMKYWANKTGKPITYDEGGIEGQIEPDIYKMK